MHPEFAKWLSEASFDVSKREPRWSAIEEISNGANSSDIDVIIRLAFGLKPPSAKETLLTLQLSAFIDKFKKADSTFDESSTREVQVLAACTLINLFDSNATAALATITANAFGARKYDLPMDIVGYAENGLRKLGAVRRKRPNLSPKQRNSAIEYQFNLGGVQPNNPATWERMFADLKDATQLTLDSICGQFRDEFAEVARYVKVADEELQMLWWLIGGRSLDLDVGFEKIGVNVRPLIFGKELADRTVEAPGPIAVGAIISRATNNDDHIDICEAVNGLDSEWVLNALKGIEPSAATSPIHFALERRSETGSGNAWKAAWTAITGIPEGHSIPSKDLGELFYRERLLLKSAK